MSISRLCVRVSKCSWESLSLNGDFTTAYTFFSVGSGTGPDTVAPVRVAVSTISFAAVSMADESQALRRVRLLFRATAAAVGFVSFRRVLGVKFVLAVWPRRLALGAQRGRSPGSRGPPPVVVS